MINIKKVLVWMAENDVNRAMLAEKAQISIETLKFALRNNRDIRISTILNICKATGLTPNDILNYEPKEDSDGGSLFDEERCSRIPSCITRRNKRLGSHEKNTIS